MQALRPVSNIMLNEFKSRNLKKNTGMDLDVPVFLVYYIIYHTKLRRILSNR